MLSGPNLVRLTSIVTHPESHDDDDDWMEDTSDTREKLERDD